MVRSGIMWCGVVWCGLVWGSMVWCGVVWWGIMWCNMVWCNMVWRGALLWIVLRYELNSVALRTELCCVARLFFELWCLMLCCVVLCAPFCFLFLFLKMPYQCPHDHPGQQSHKQRQQQDWPARQHGVEHSSGRCPGFVIHNDKCNSWRTYQWHEFQRALEGSIIFLSHNREGQCVFFFCIVFDFH